MSLHGFLLVLLAACLGLAWTAGSYARSAAVGVTAAILTTVAVAAHVLHGLAMGLAEGAAFTGYNWFAGRFWFPLLLVYMALPGLLVVAVHARRQR